MAGTIVIKVGGSLLTWPQLPARLTDLLSRTRHHSTVLIVGGSRAVDFVRELDSIHGIGQKRAHDLALNALDLTASALTALVPGLRRVDDPDEIAEARSSGAIPVLAPRRFMEKIDHPSPAPLPATWAVTSDSIAARLAVYLRADELWLLKSTGLGASLTRERAARDGLVDPIFPEASATLPRVLLINLKANPPTEEILDRDPLKPRPLLPPFA
ncbi:MAG: hypothetical protein NVSMB9_33670 [Isosphaeraceae bacterium]